MRSHRPTCLSRWPVVLTGCMLITLVVTQLPVSMAAQPLCPFDTIWDAEAEACVPLEPTPTETATPTVTPEATLTPEPTAATDPEPSPTAPPDAAPTEPAGVENEPGDEPTPAPTLPANDEAAPGMGTPSPYFLGGVIDWLVDWCCSFSAELPQSGIVIMEYECNQAITPADSPDVIAARCPAMPAERDIWYEFIFSTGLYASIHRGNDPVWRGTIPAGGVTIVSRYEEEKRYLPPIAACVRTDEYGDNPVVVTMPQTTSAGTLHVPGLPAGGVLVCSYFYMWDVERPITVDLIAYTCPQRVVTESLYSYADLVVLCGLPAREVEMQMIAADGVSSTFTSMGLATFTDVPAGTIVLREHIPQGYGAPLVYCMVVGQDGQTFQSRDIQILGDGYYLTIDTIPAGASVLCEFFNLPGRTPNQGGGPPRT